MAKQGPAGLAEARGPKPVPFVPIGESGTGLAYFTDHYYIFNRFLSIDLILYVISHFTFLDPFTEASTSYFGFPTKLESALPIITVSNVAQHLHLF